jgi:hypothetical protein
MRVRVRCDEDANLCRQATDDLLDDLFDRIDTIAERVSDDALEVVVIGSYSESGMRTELERRVRAWEAAGRASGVTIEIGT